MNSYIYLSAIPYDILEWSTIFILFIDNYSRYGYLYLIHEKYQSVDVFKACRAYKNVKFDRGGEYYGRYDGSGKQRP